MIRPQVRKEKTPLCVDGTDGQLDNCPLVPVTNGHEVGALRGDPHAAGIQ